MMHKIEYFVGLISHIRSKLVDYYFFFPSISIASRGGEGG